MYGTTDYTLVDASDLQWFLCLDWPGAFLPLRYLSEGLFDCLLYRDLSRSILVLIVMYLLDWIGAMAIHVLRMYSV